MSETRFLRKNRVSGQRLTLLALSLLLASGCGGGNSLEVDYGRSRGKSLNGTRVFAEMLRAEGHTVRSAFRLTDELNEWADAIVRFAPYSGPPRREESDWYDDWLEGGDDRRLVYVPMDDRVASEYWDQVLKTLPDSAAPKLKERAKKFRDESKTRFQSNSAFSKEEEKDLADPNDWFAVEPGKSGSETCKTLGGPWSRGVDASEAALARHDTLKVESETVLLEGDGKPLVIEWTRFNQSQVLVAANGTFLLNAALLNRARRPLAVRTARWLGPEPLKVAFVEGGYVVGNQPASPTPFTLLKIHPFGWIAAQVLAVGLAACLARAPRLGRPRPEPVSGEDRPVANPEAIGMLLAKTGRADDARSILETYRRWRYASQPDRVVLPPTDVDQPEILILPESPSNE